MIFSKITNLLFLQTSASHGGNEWKRAFKENNDTYAAPTSDRVERLGYSSGGSYGGSVNVILLHVHCLWVNIQMFFFLFY